METKDLRKKDTAELQKMVQDLKKKLSDYRFKFSSNKVKNVQEVGNTKRDVARILTILNEKK